MAKKKKAVSDIPKKRGRKPKGFMVRNIHRTKKQMKQYDEKTKKLLTSTKCTNARMDVDSTIIDVEPPVSRPPPKKRKMIHIVENSPESKSDTSMCQQTSKTVTNSLQNQQSTTNEQTLLGENRLIELKELRKIIEHHTCCKYCGGSFRMEDKTIGLATQIKINCNKCEKTFTTDNQRTTFYKPNSYNTSESYLVNLLFVLGLQQIGCGSSESGIILTFLGLPHAQGFHRHSFRKLESKMRSIVKGICLRSMDEALHNEVEKVLQDDETNERKEMLNNNQLKPFDVPITIGYDMGWNKRSSGRLYNSISGHGIMVGARTKKVVNYKSISKCCSFCRHFKKKMGKRQ